MWREISIFLSIKCQSICEAELKMSTAATAGSMRSQKNRSALKSSKRNVVDFSL
jgi:hypothetical protein